MIRMLDNVPGIWFIIAGTKVKEEILMTCTHGKFEVPTDPHGKKRYESAMKHVEAAKKAGKTSEEIHALFKRIMEHDPLDIASIPKDEAHAKYRTAMVHVKSALEKGSSSKEVHEIYRRIMSGETKGHCAAGK